jgi:YtcA family
MTLLLPLVAAAACDPIINVAGANFPAWLLCAIVGVVGLVLLRVTLLQSAVEPYLWWAPGVYASAGLLIASLVWIIFFNRV